jgi:phospholipase/carboxylesterase
VIDLIDSLVGQGIGDRKAIFLIGFSQSCALNYRFAFTFPDRLRGVIGICGGLPGDWETSEIYKPTDAAVLHLAGMRDEFYPPARVADYDERLNLRAREVAFSSYDAGHEIVPQMRDDVRQWLAERAG